MSIYHNLSITIDEQGLRMDIDAVMQACPVLEYPAATLDQYWQLLEARPALEHAAVRLICAADVAGAEVRARFAR